MGRSPCCSNKEGLNRGAWAAQEDKILKDYVNLHGSAGKWRNLPQRAGLNRCGKSCRLRWLNYLRPDIKRGNISEDEEDLIIRLHKLLGNRWSLIAGRIPGRTDNEIKNYWNTNLRKKMQDDGVGASTETNPFSQSKPQLVAPSLIISSPSPPPDPKPNVIHTKASKCSKLVVQDPLPHHSPMQITQSGGVTAEELSKTEAKEPLFNVQDGGDVVAVNGDWAQPFSWDDDLLLDFDVGEISGLSDFLNFDFLENTHHQDLMPFSDTEIPW